jgi:hypothetical protein
MDTSMSDSSGPPSKKSKSDVKAGAEQVGQGLQVVIPRAVPHVFNNNFTVRLTYSDTYNLGFEAWGGSYDYRWALNSIYDPDQTGTGHQPLGRDLWASMYDYYAVLSTDYYIELYNGAVDSITYTAAGTSAQRVNGCVATILPSTNATDITNLSTGVAFPAVEMKHTQSKALWPEDSISFSGTLTPADFLVDAKDSDTDTTWTAVGSNPAVTRWLGLGLNSCTASSLAGASEAPWINVQAFVKFDYTVQFTQVNQTLRAVPS